MATNHSISDFITGFGGGTRQNRFLITGTIGSDSSPNTSSTFEKNVFYVRTATLPNSTLGGIPVNYRGRTVVYPGERVYSPWQITVLDDKPSGKTKLFEAFHAWSNGINNHLLNTTTTSGLDPSNHFANTNWTVEQLDTNGGTTLTGRKFTLFNCWPQTVGDLALDMGADNTLASFAVTIFYSHYSIT
tara:strand:- start:95 stop:658 length:564 start_codon:yes stop_codon:yes gene_type:complete